MNVWIPTKRELQEMIAREVSSQLLTKHRSLAADWKPETIVTTLSDGSTITDETPVEKLGLSVRALNTFNNAKIQTLGQLCKLPEQWLLRHRGFGHKTLMEVKGVLASIGRDLNTP